MERRVFEAALRAAAKITFGGTMMSTFGGTLLGCGGVVTIDPSDSESEETSPSLGGNGPVDLPSDGGYAPSDGGYAANGGAGEGGSVEVPVCAQPAAPAAGWPIYDEATFDCCVERIDAFASEPDFLEGFQQDNVDCCTQVISENYDAIWQGLPLVHEAPPTVIAACCSLINGTPGCTPWGPPVPVAMDPGDFVPWVMDELGEHPVRRVA